MANAVETGSGSGGPSPSSFGIMDVPESTPEPAETQPEAGGASPEAKATGTAGGAGVQTQASETTGTVTTDLSEGGAAQPASKFKFLGREYDNQDVAEQSFKSWEGRIRAEQDRNSKLVNQMNEYYAYVQRANEILQERTAPGTAAAGQPQGNGEDKAPKKFSETIDWSQVAEIKRLATAAGHDPEEYVNRFMAEKYDEYSDARLTALEAKLSAPMEAMQERETFDTATTQAFVYARDLVDDRGESRYPELGGKGPDSVNEPFVAEMHQAWYQIAQEHPAFAFSERGIDYAYSVARQNYQEKSPAPAATNGNAEGVTRDESGRFVKQSKTAAKAVMAPDSVNPPAVQSDEEQDDGSAEFLSRHIHRNAARPLQTRSGIGLGFSR